MILTRPRLSAFVAGVALLIVGVGLVGILAARAVTPRVAGSQARNGNVSVYGETTWIHGTIHGDLSVQNHSTVTVTGHVMGRLRAYGASSILIDPGGRVDGGILQSTGTLRLEPGAWVGTGLDTYNLSDDMNLGGHVAGQVRISASGVEVGPQALVAGDLWVWAAPAQLVQVDGTVDGSVHVSGTDLHLGRTSQIHGSTTIHNGKITHS